MPRRVGGGGAELVPDLCTARRGEGGGVRGEAFCAGVGVGGGREGREEKRYQHVGGPRRKSEERGSGRLTVGPMACKTVSLLPQLPPGILGLGWARRPYFCPNPAIIEVVGA